jgi:hypothetical protein
MADCTYNATLTTAQTFIVSGTVTLPSGVENPDDAVSLAVSIRVSVNASSGSSGSGGSSGGGGSSSGGTDTGSSSDTGDGSNGGGTTPGGADAVPTDSVVTVTPDNVTIDGASGAATASVKEGDIVKALEQAVDAASKAGTVPIVEIKVDNAGASAVKVRVLISDLQAVAGSEAEEIDLEISVTDVGQVIVNKAAVKDLVTITNAGSAAAVEIAVERKEPLTDKDLTQSQKAVLNADEKVRAVYDISVLVNSQKKSFETAGNLTIGLPYALEPGEDDGGVWAIHVKEDGSKELMRDGRRNENSTAYFKTNHLSVYAVTYDPEASSEADSAKSSGGGGCDAGAGVFVLLALALAFTVSAASTTIRSGAKR